MNKKSKVGRLPVWLQGWRGVLAFAIIWVGIGALWYVRRPLPLDRQAVPLLEAMLAADGRTLMDYAFEEEIDANALSAKKLSRLYSELVLPRLKLVKMDDEMALQDNGGQGIAEFSCHTVNGNEFILAAKVYPTENGVSGSVLSSLYSAWMFEYFSRKKTVFSLETRNQAVLEGIRKDIHVLKDIGITKMSDIDVLTGTVSMMDIDDMEARYANWIASPNLRP